MESWKKITFLVGVFAFVRELRPIEPFYAAYMTSPYINCTVEQVIQCSYVRYVSVFLNLFIATHVVLHLQDKKSLKNLNFLESIWLKKKRLAINTLLYVISYIGDQDLLIKNDCWTAH